jgi:hypothetical protein
MCDQREADYGFGAAAAEAAEVAASAAALAAAAESAAADAAESAAAAGGVVSVVGAGASVLLPQALNTSAATKALNASLVFIYRYPRKYILIKLKGRACFRASTQTSRPILEGFTSISYHFRRSCTGCNVKQRSRSDARPVESVSCCCGVWCILGATLRQFYGSKA